MQITTTGTQIILILFALYVTPSNEKNNNIISGSTVFMQLCQYTENFGKFLHNFIFPKSVKTHNCDIENSRLGRDLPISVNDRVISPIK